MSKKLALLVVAGLALAALVLPAAASASPFLLEGGVPVAKGTKILATSSNAQITTPLGTVVCKTWTFKQELTKNPGNEVELVGKSATTSTCTLGGKAVTVTSSNLTLFTANGEGDAGVAFPTIVVDLPGPITCEYGGIGVFTYTTGSDVVKVNGNNMTASPKACQPAPGTTVFEGEFTLTTESGTPVVIS